MVQGLIYLSTINLTLMLLYLMFLVLTLYTKHFVITLVTLVINVALVIDCVNNTHTDLDMIILLGLFLLSAYYMIAELNENES